MNLFELASRQAFRFQSAKGELTVEQLWTLPLQSKTGFDLDNVARVVNGDLKAMSEGSFVNTEANPAIARQEAKLELVKYIIAAKLAENAAAAAKASNKAMKDQLINILEQKQSQELMNLTPAELQAKIAALG